MNYIQNKEFIESELIPFIETLVSDYIDDEIEYAESVDELDEVDYMNCPEDLKAEILENIENLVIECIDDYDIITDMNQEEYEEQVGAIIENVFEDVKAEKMQIVREDLERSDYFEEFED